MDTVPEAEPPHKKTRDVQKKSIADEAGRRWLRLLLALRSKQAAEGRSLGRALLPFLSAAMETCWVDAVFIALAGFNLFGSRDPLMPLWAPFVIMSVSQVVLGSLESRTQDALTEGDEDEDQRGIGGESLPSSRFIWLVCILTLGIVWASVYARIAFLFDPRWLLMLVNDVLLLNLRAYHCFFIVAISGYLCWRGMRQWQRVYEPSHISGMLRLGMGVILGVILLRAAQAGSGVVFSDNALVLLLVPVFLCLSLAAHALARIAFERRMHPGGQEGDIASSERAILLTVGGIGVIMLLAAWVVDSVASRTLLEETQLLFGILGRGYDWLVNIVLVILVVLVTPLFWLFDWWLAHYPPHGRLPASAGTQARLPPHIVPHASSIAPVLLPLLHLLLPVVLILCAVIMLRRVARRGRRARAGALRRGGEVRESLWTWRLFLAQLQALLRVLYRCLWPRRAAREGRPLLVESGHGPAGARSIRELYRALLQRAARCGYPRAKNETPFEFQQRLNAQTPLAQPHIAPLTETYTAARYGGAEPGEAEIARARRAWALLEEQWRQPQGPP